MSNTKRGHFGIGICNGKTSSNVGTLWRSAYQLGADWIFTTGTRYQKQASDTVKAWRHIPQYEYEQLSDLVIPHDAQIVGVETEGTPLEEFEHPERAVYLLGAEDTGLSKEALARCQHIIEIPSIRIESYNVAVAGSIIMYDRLMKRKLK